MKYGLQTQLAKTIGIKPQTINDYLAGRSGASAPVAKKIAALTDSDPFIWMKGGDIQARRAAVEKLDATEYQSTKNQPAA